MKTLLVSLAVTTAMGAFAYTTFMAAYNKRKQEREEEDNLFIGSKKSKHGN
jgi:hypothetical protein